jgi:two-component SAPR family response regulator
LPDTAAARGALEAPGKIDLLIVDLVMPAGQPNGLAFAEEARQHLPDAPIIFITGYYGFVARSGELPGTVLYKPVDLDLLTREIGERLGG